MGRKICRIHLSHEFDVERLHEQDIDTYSGTHRDTRF